MIPPTRREQITQVRAAFGDWPKTLLAGALWKALPLPPASTVLRTRGGTRVACPLRRDAGALYTALEVFAFGAYEPLGELGPDPYVIDIGANLGAFLLWAGERSSGVRGMAYEPDPLACEFLRRNVGLNRLDGVTVEAAAVGASSGSGTLHRSGDGGGVSTLHPETGTPGTLDQALDVPIVAFDELIASLAGQTIDVLKMDCEGAEHDIVHESSDASWTSVQRIALEYHPVRGRTVAELERRLRTLGFTVTERDAFGHELGMLWLKR